jgi:hypothetical protein
MPDRSPNPWNRRHLLIAAFVVLYLALQVAIPSAMLAARSGWIFAPARPATGELPFSWQMYTVVLAPPTLDVVYPNGHEVQVDLDSMLGETGGRSAYGNASLAGLCERYPGAARVVYQSAGSTKSHAC